MKKHRVILLTTVFCVLVFLSGCGEQSKYESAVALMDDGDYESALEAFTEIEDYEDSAEKISECKYALGNLAMESEDWDLAISYFEDLDYEDSADLLETCTREKGMNENADYDFLAAIEESILDRLETSSSGTSNYASLVNTELSYLEEFADATFYDDELKSIAEKYIEGLYLQKEALSAEYEFEYQSNWYRGKVYREEALVALYENYDFLTDNNDFIASYIYQYEDDLAFITAFDVIEEDIDNQLGDGIDWTIYTDTGEAFFYVTNNTEYTYSTVFDLLIYDSDNVLIESDSVLIESIAPGVTYEVSWYISDPDEAMYMSWSNYYTDIVY